VKEWVVAAFVTVWLLGIFSVGPAMIAGFIEPEYRRGHVVEGLKMWGAGVAGLAIVSLLLLPVFVAVRA
jgi:hypothetical protein